MSLGFIVVSMSMILAPQVSAKSNSNASLSTAIGALEINHGSTQDQVELREGAVDVRFRNNFLQNRIVFTQNGRSVQINHRASNILDRNNITLNADQINQDFHLEIKNVKVRGKRTVRREGCSVSGLPIDVINRYGTGGYDGIKTKTYQNYKGKVIIKVLDKETSSQIAKFKVTSPKTYRRELISESACRLI